MAPIDLAQIVGALLVLAGYALSQTGRIDAEGWPYQIVNAVGSGILAVVAFAAGRWGFLLMEGAWCLVSLGAMVALARRPPREGRR